MATKKLSAIVIDALEDIKARDIKLINVSKLTSVFDYIAVASADSTRQTKALAKNVMDKVKESGGWIYGTEGEQSGEWVLVDCGDVVVHIMQPVIREHYKLEELWGEGKLEYPKPVAPKRKPAVVAVEKPKTKAKAKATAAKVAKPKGKVTKAKSVKAKSVTTVATTKVSKVKKSVAKAKPVTKKTVAKKATTAGKNVKASTVKKPVTKKAAVKKTAVKKPVAKKPVVARRKATA